MAGSTTVAGGRRIRRRQDLTSIPDFERHMNDLAADDQYEQILLGSIRTGSDPNAKAVVEVYEGYVPPTADPVKEAQVATRHREVMRNVYNERETIIHALRSSEEHQKLPAFDRLLRETEYYTGVREWSGGSGMSSSGPGWKRSQFFQSAGEEGVDGSSSGLDLAHLTETPSYIRGKLRPYQLEGVNWLLSLFSRAVNGILADEMGLGKTFQTIATLAYLKFTVGLPGPHLVVCPKSVMGNWYREFKHWCPGLSVFKFHAPSDLRPSVMRSHLQPVDHIRYDVVVTTFEMVLDEINTFKKISWQYLIVDEAHKLKNEEGRAHLALASLHTSHRLIITGTPLQNNLKELWALLNFLAPRLFNDPETFNTWFDTATGQQDAGAMSNLHKILTPLMIRRLKADVNTGIPPKKEIYVSCKLTKKQREWYMHILAKDAEVLNKATGGATSLTNVLMNLRKVINHPYLMDGGEEGPPFITDERIVKLSGKMLILDKLLRRLRDDVAGGHKVLLFSQFTSMLNILEDYCNMRGFKYCRIDGNTSGYERDAQMASFNAPNGECFLFLLSTRAGGLGINLQAANHVILYDSDWNPQMDLQAQDRAHRIGQKRSVRVYRMVTDGTVEERIYRRALKKLYLDAVVVQQGRLQSKQTNAASKEELLSMIKFGAEDIFRSRQEDVTEADIDRLLEQGEEWAAQLTTDAKKQVQVSLASFELGAEEANVYDFEGVSYRSGVTTRMLHLRLPHPVAQADLHAQCAEFGEVIKVVLHPNLQEALVQFRSTSGAIEAKAHLPYESSYAGRDGQTVVSSEMISECLGAGGEKLGRGHRHREPVQLYSEEDVEKIRTKTTGPPPPKLPKAPKFLEHQLFNTRRLLELHNTEVALIMRNWKRQCARAEAQASISGATAAALPVEGESTKDTAHNDTKPITGVNEEAQEEEEEELLTSIEQEERERLLTEGFPNWSKSEYRALITAVTSGAVDITDYTHLAEAVGGDKTVGEVRDYMTALLERGETCISSFGKVEARIRKAQAAREAKENMRRAAKWKVEHTERPETQLAFKTKGNPALDRRVFLLGYDHGFQRANAGEMVRALPEYRLDVWCQSRPEGFFDRRLHSLMVSVRKEWEKVMEDAEPESARTRRRLED